MKRYELDNNYYLREVNIKDSFDIFEFSKDEEVTKYLTWYPHQNINDTRWVINNLFLNNQKYPNTMAIIDKKLNKVIGIINFLDGNIPTNDYPNIGYFLNKKYWNNGIMTKALNKMIEIGFYEYDYPLIAISHMIENIGSEKIILKSNFKYIKTINNFNLGKHKNVSIKYYEIKRSDYNDKKS